MAATSTVTTRRTTGEGAGALARMEFTSTEDVAAYAAKARQISVSLALELESGAHTLARTLARSTEGPMFDRVKARLLARRATRQLRAAAAHHAAAADSAARFWHEFGRLYADQIHPKRRDRKFRFEAS